MKQGKMNIGTVMFGFASAMQTIICAKNVMEYSAAKSAALEQILRATPAASQQMYEAAVQTAHQMASGNYNAAIMAGALVVTNAICAGIYSTYQR